MTLGTTEIALIRRDNAITLAQAREVSDLTALLRSAVHLDSEATEAPGTRWALWRGEPGHGGPVLLAGVRGDRGTLSWFDAGGQTEFVPAGTRLGGPSVEYWRGGQPEGCGTGEEIEVDLVFTAVHEFVATAERPDSVEWVRAGEIPRDQPEPRIEDNPLFQAWQAALE